MNFTCPICFYDKLEEPPQNYNICECCGTEFGNDDELRTHEQLRARWVKDGSKWFFGESPAGWNAAAQLASGQVAPR